MDHCLWITVPRTYEEPKIRIEKPKLPTVMETDYLGPYPREAIHCHEHNCHAYDVKHGLGADIIFALNEPVNINA